MKVAIIEDEKPAAGKLQKALLAIGGIEVVAVLGSIREVTSWLQENDPPDLLFMDIELSDGLSFRLFEQQGMDVPVIFTTAYDEYWQEAFEHNGIDYLLKPIKEEKLANALKKYEKLKQYFSESTKKLTGYSVDKNGRYKKRFLVKRGTDLVSIKAEDIAYFYATHKMVCLVDRSAQKFILDGALSDMEKLVDPAQFYRVNRKYLVNMNAIKRIRSFAKSKLLLELSPPVEEEVIISQEGASDFKQWLEA